MFDEIQNIEKSNDLLGRKAHEPIQDVNRRDLLKLGLLGILGSVTPLLPGRSAEAANGGAWKINLHHSHTDEAFRGVYRVGDRYIPEAFERMNYVLRDFRTGEIFPMDPRVIDILSIMQSKIRGDAPFEVLSGYRSPKTNAMLRRVGSGVAKNSYHMYGQALDIRMWGYSTRRVRDVARSLRAGGVGYYPKSNFVHVDTGKIRSW